MDVAPVYRVLVVVVMAIHALIVLFTTGGELAIVVGAFAGWRWVRNAAFRAAHLGVIAVVTVTTLIGESCSVTTLENWLRAQGGLATYTGGFIEHWIDRILYIPAPHRAFVVAYTLFGVAVLASWFLVRPDWPRRSR